MSFENLTIVRPHETCVTYLNRIAEIFRELSKESVQPRVKFIGRQIMSLEFEQEWSRVQSKLCFTVGR